MSLERKIKDPIDLKDGTAPLLIMLHGYGSNEEDLFSFSSELNPKLRIVSFRAPLNLGMGGYAWYSINFDADQNKFSDLEQAQNSMTKLKQEIEDLQHSYGNTQENTFLLGFSQGCILSMALGLNYPKTVSKIIGLSGYLMKELLPEAFDDLSKVDIYNSHGTMDQVIPVSWAEKTAGFMEEHHISYVFETYPAGHGVNPQNFFAMRNWLDSRI